jgi:hypothetical protein
MSHYSSDELKESDFFHFEDLYITFGPKVEDLEDTLKPLVKEKNFNYNEFKNLFKDKAEFINEKPRYPFDQKVYEFLRPFIPHFPFSVEISALWCYDEGIDMVFNGTTSWNRYEWKEENVVE